MYPFYLGIDLHLKRTYMVLMDAKGVRAIADAAVKTDQIDAPTIAHLARMNYIPKAYAACKEMRDLRQLLRHREWMVNQRSKAKNRIYAALAGYNLVSPVTDLFGVAGREYLHEMMDKELRPSAQQVVEDHLAMIDHLTERIHALEKNISLNEKQDHIANILRSMPGVGKLIALTILAEVGDIRRFHSPKSLCSWAGLTPRVRNSDAVVHHGHITKEGTLAGPKSLEHIVDVVLSFEGERDHSYRVLRVLKNRFGPVSELAIFEMSEEGLKSVENPSAFFLRERPGHEPGSVVVCTLKGTRPLLAEIQALVSSSLFLGNPRRMTVGLDRFRAAMLMAIAEKKLGYSFAGEDVYLNVAGGLAIEEPAADLGILLAVVSSVKNRALPPEVAVFGEIGLSGEIRSVTQPGLRIKEAASLGFKTIILPQGNKNALTQEKRAGIELIGVKDVRQAIKLFF